MRIFFFITDYSEVTNAEPANQINSADVRNMFDEDCDESKSSDNICKPGIHIWKHDVCMVCTVCKECTGYSISCLSSIRSNRKPGQ